jgi:hypothetical protein
MKKCRDVSPARRNVHCVDSDESKYVENSTHRCLTFAGRASAKAVGAFEFRHKLN